MGDLRLDPMTARWVIISTEKDLGPDGYDIESPVIKGGTCPFCPENEKMTPPEIDADRPTKTAVDTPGWETRTVPNKYPALKNEPGPDRQGVGMFDMMNGIGEHEVIIEDIDHDKQLADLSVEQIEKVIRVYKRRSIELGKDERFKYVLIFKNYGLAAGASLEHSHTQLISLPIIPKRVMEELECAHRYFDYKERCVFCDIAKQEIEHCHREISENDDFVAFSPFASRSPFEMHIMPKVHNPYFTDISDSEIVNFAKILKDVLMRIKVALKDAPYNFIIHTTPLNGNHGIQEYYHWHVEVMPKLSKIAGFEWGTGFYINATSPETASKILREAKV
ncbi:MAG: galactose-1-phosphate uridylyltransferase [Candidatus Omnitrophica bacterium]|nr:galactose-1-phosphate uridylyltransferase [Candidatus Omnitrophota bacterium]